MTDGKPKVTLREAQLIAKIRRLKADLYDMSNASQTVFRRCACGRMAERGIICPTNQEGGECEAGR
jgi:hypothetical protein